MPRVKKEKKIEEPLNKKIKIKVGKKWETYVIISIEEDLGWIKIKSKINNSHFYLNKELHQHHIKIIE